MTPQMQAIEFVASNAQYRRKGVASEIIKHIIKEDHHTVFVLRLLIQIPVLFLYIKK